MFKKIIYVYFKNYAKHINTMCGENTKFSYIKLDRMWCAFLPSFGGVSITRFLGVNETVRNLPDFLHGPVVNYFSFGYE
jgi:hypothetical protein